MEDRGLPSRRRASVRPMRRSSFLYAAAMLSLAVATACATSPEPELDALTTDTQGTDPGPTLPPPSNAPAKDAGAPKADSGAKDSGATDGGGQGSQQDAAPPPPGSCDVSDPLKTFFYSLEASEQPAPVPCPCAVGQCCFMAQTCVEEI